MHQSTLALRSEIFRDIFSLPSPADLNSAPLETIEGFLVVRVTDSLAEIRHLFLVLCCGKNYLVDRDEDTAVPFPVISALIRMTHNNTNDFAAWRDRAARGTRYVHVEANDALGWLPDDGEEPKTLISCLDPMDQFRVLLAKALLFQHRTLRLPYSLSSVPSDRCTTVARCAQVRNAVLRHPLLIAHMAGDTFTEKYILGPVHERLWGDAQQRSICPNCVAASIAEDEMQRT
ncbi:hypothetical protein BD309DRAFT_1018197 [Dichomitus squalens]|uniref:Uncharacterized protein n=1 Tax=Dichomitus squalens TaxID=114155 RepID=A0A4Q9NZ57_9APHY|nr:hypothetical protein BD309DRAFT_1018197 [Dichomitus squalens]TBU56509.1 hypothetical protein BD310DRAFT_1040447 [Dichomitus squalens]